MPPDTASTRATGAFRYCHPGEIVRVRPTYMIRIVAALAAAQFVAGAAFAADASSGTVPLAGSRPVVTTLTPADNPSGAAQGDVAQLAQLLRDGQLTEMRTTYNGSYGASLFFHTREMTYYVALFQNKSFWRVVKTDERPRAEMIYNNFVQQTVRLSEIEIQRAELDAQKQFLERVISVSEQKADRLRADLAIARDQQAQVNARQRATREQTEALQVETKAAQIQLDNVRKQVQKLQHDSEVGLPTFRPQH
ncbi:DUF2968 domain-containing protein [Burkholderia ubonensis]|uniref:DUF2968 domain-containing protein n=1 Tax=Burkholderia ubonensis TaxID=101571 RepID=UPI0039F541A3